MSVNDIVAEKEIKEAFAEDDNGNNNVEELRYVFANMGWIFFDEDIAKMLKQADFDGYGAVKYKGILFSMHGYSSKSFRWMRKFSLYTFILMHINILLKFEAIIVP